MGIGTTVKSMLGTDHTDEDQRRMSRTRSNEASSQENPNRLPAGTGPGTSGRPTDPSSEREVERDRPSQGIAGTGTAAAAAGGSQGGTQTGTQRTSALESGTRTGHTGTVTALGTDLASTSGTGSLKRDSGVRDTGAHEQRQAIPGTIVGTSGDTETRRDAGETPRVSTLEGGHTFGHTSLESMPDSNAEEYTDRLQPVVHERVRHVELEEVARVKDHERHIHHIQHHTQPLIASEELPEEHRTVTHPVTRITETHAAKPEHDNLFKELVHQYHDTLTHAPKERTVIDKGTVVNEHVHHHIHHVMQPIIMKETVDRQRVHTTIPIHEITHEAPVVHQSKVHPPTPLETFVRDHGSIFGGVPHDKISDKMMHHGQCERHVEGIAEKLERELNLGQSTVHHDELPATKEMAGPADRGAVATAETPVTAPSKN